MKKASRLATLALGAVLAGIGCASTSHLTSAQKRGYATKREAVKVLDVPASHVRPLPGGYKTSLFGEAELIKIAGVYEGTRTIERDRYGSFSTGYYIPLRDTNSLIRASREADDGDMIITNQEAKNLFERVSKEVYRKYKN